MVIVVGCDPSSAKLAFCATPPDDSLHPQMWTKALGKNPPSACAAAYAEIERIVTVQYVDMDVHLYIERPIVARGHGPGSSFPQVRVNGAIHAACGKLDVFIQEIDQASWKKHIAGRANIPKDAIATAVLQAWPRAYDAARGDKDLYDAAGINSFARWIERAAAAGVVVTPTLRKKVQQRKAQTT